MFCEIEAKKNGRSLRWWYSQADWGMAIEHEGMSAFHDTQSVCFLRKMVWGVIKHGLGR